MIVVIDGTDSMNESIFGRSSEVVTRCVISVSFRPEDHKVPLLDDRDASLCAPVM